jgi:hypothetical protein
VDDDFNQMNLEVNYTDENEYEEEKEYKPT